MNKENSIPKTFEDFVQSSKARSNYRSLMVPLTDVYGRNNMDVLHEIAAYVYPNSLFKLYTKIVIEIVDGISYDHGVSSYDIPVYRFTTDNLITVFTTLTELVDIKEVTWNFICSSGFANVNHNFYKFWDYLENDKFKKHTVMCSDFALHVLPLNLQEKFLSSERKDGIVDMYLCSDAKILGQLHGSIDLLYKAKDMESDMDDFKISINRMSSTRILKNVTENINVSIIAKDKNNEPIYVQVLYKGIIFNLLSAHFCELKTISDNEKIQKNILKTVGVDDSIVENITPVEMKRMASCVLQRQSSCTTGKNLKLVRELTEQNSEYRNKVISNYLPKKQNCLVNNSSDNCLVNNSSDNDLDITKLVLPKLERQ